MTRSLYLLIPALGQAGAVDWEAAGRIRDYVFSIEARSDRVAKSDCALKTISTIDNRMRVVRQLFHKQFVDVYLSGDYEVFVKQVRRSAKGELPPNSLLSSISMERVVLKELEKFPEMFPRVYEDDVQGGSSACYEERLVTTNVGTSSMKYLVNNDISQKVLFEIGAKILSIIKQVHSLGIVHGDLHFSNIAIGDIDADPVESLRIIDFGESTMFVDPTTRSHISEFVSVDNETGKGHFASSPWELLFFPRSRRDDFFRIAFVLLLASGASPPSFAYKGTTLSHREVFATGLCLVHHPDHPELNGMIREACSMGFTDDPKYEYWINLFTEKARSLEISDLKVVPSNLRRVGDMDQIATELLWPAILKHRARSPISLNDDGGEIPSVARTDCEIRFGIVPIRPQGRLWVVGISPSLSSVLTVAEEETMFEPSNFVSVCSHGLDSHSFTSLDASARDGGGRSCSPRSRLASPISILDGVDFEVGSRIQMQQTASQSAAQRLMTSKLGAEVDLCVVENLTVEAARGSRFELAGEQYRGSGKTKFYFSSDIVVKIVPQSQLLISQLDTEKAVYRAISELPSDHSIKRFTVSIFDFTYATIVDPIARYQCERRTLVIEKAGETNLSELVPMTNAAMSRVAVELIKALRAIHSIGIIHGDIHLRNIVLREGGYLKLIDFGRARVYVEGGNIPEPEFTDFTCFRKGLLSPFELENFPPILRDDMYRVSETLYRASGKEGVLDACYVRKSFSDESTLAGEKRHWEIDGFPELVEFHKEMTNLEYFDRPDYEKWEARFQEAYETYT